MVMLKDVPSLMVENRKYHMGTVQDSDAHCECDACTYSDGFNKAIEEIGFRKIGFNREKLEKLLSKTAYECGISIYPLLNFLAAIISAEASILEVKE